MEELGVTRRLDSRRISLISRIGIGACVIIVVEGIRQQLVIGHSSTVYLGKYRSGSVVGHGQLVAVKIMRVHAARSIGDTLREIMIASQCQHRNIVQYIGDYRTGVTPITTTLNIVTEFMEGGDLLSYLEDEYVCDLRAHTLYGIQMLHDIDLGNTC